MPRGAYAHVVLANKDMSEQDDVRRYAARTRLPPSEVMFVEQKSGSVMLA